MNRKFVKHAATIRRFGLLLRYSGMAITQIFTPPRLVKRTTFGTPPTKFDLMNSVNRAIISDCDDDLVLNQRIKIIASVNVG